MNLILGALIIFGIAAAAWGLVVLGDMMTRDKDGFPREH